MSEPAGSAVVSDVGWVNGLAAVRSLGRAGVEVVAVDHRVSALGFHSRYARPLVVPDPVADEDGFAAALAALGERLPGPASLMPTHDEHLNAAARRAAELGGRFRLPFPGWDVLGPIQRKAHQLEAAAAAGVPIPETRRPASAAEALAAARELGYPVIVKPSEPTGFRRRHARQNFRPDGPRELEAAYAAAEPFGALVQEVVPGGDDHLWTLGSYLAADGEALGLFCGRKLRQTGEGAGTCRVGEARWSEPVVEQGLRLLRALGFHGLSQVEFKLDPRDGAFRLMEVNPRLWQWHGLAAAVGVDLPRIAHLDLMGRRPAPVRMRGEGRRWAITLMAGGAPALVRPPYVDAVFARDDPRPGLAQLARLGRAGARTAAGMLRRR